MTQAQASLARIQSGEYTPDSAARSFQFEDGSSLVLVDGAWIALHVCGEDCTECRLATVITEETTCRCGHYGGSTGTEKNLHTHCATCGNTTDANGVCRRGISTGRCPDAEPEVVDPSENSAGFERYDETNPQHRAARAFYESGARR